MTAPVKCAHNAAGDRCAECDWVHMRDRADRAETELARVTAERDFARNDALAQAYVVRDLRDALRRVAGEDAGIDGPGRGRTGPQSDADPTSGQGDPVCAQPGNDGGST